MKYTISILLFVLFSCKSKENVNVEVKTELDTFITRSIKLSDSSISVLNLADKKTEVFIKGVSVKMDNLKLDNFRLKSQVSALKNENKNVKPKVIRDTIYITEKKNFWGKTKRTIDSSHTNNEDSLQHK